MSRWDGDQVTQFTGEPALYWWMTDLAATLMIWTWPDSNLTASTLSWVSTSGQFSWVSSLSGRSSGWKLDWSVMSQQLSWSSPLARTPIHLISYARIHPDIQ